MFRDGQKRFLTLFAFLGTLLILTGCLRRVEVVTRERLDQRLEGNRGVLYGSVPKTPSKAPTTRQYMEWDIEVPTYEVAMRVPEWHREWHDKELWGNRGYITGGPRKPPKKVETLPSREPEKPASSFFRRPTPPSAESEWEKPAPPAPSYTTYTVKKGDTLGDISSKVYGTSKRWKPIYEANKDILKDPNHLKPGQVLRIPKAEARMKVISSETIK